MWACAGNCQYTENFKKYRPFRKSGTFICTEFLNVKHPKPVSIFYHPVFVLTIQGFRLKPFLSGNKILAQKRYSSIFIESFLKDWLINATIIGWMNNFNSNLSYFQNYRLCKDWTISPLQNSAKRFRKSLNRFNPSWGIRKWIANKLLDLYMSHHNH